MDWKPPDRSSCIARTKDWNIWKLPRASIPGGQSDLKLPGCPAGHCEDQLVLTTGQMGALHDTHRAGPSLNSSQVAPML
jgi:hypothetical protein